jgi:hypothetical protein
MVFQSKSRTLSFVALFVLLGLLGSCGDRDQLREGHARHTAEALIAAEGPRLRDFHHMEWRGVRRTSPTEAQADAVLVYRFRLPSGGTGQEQIQGKFLYKKDPRKGWVLVGIDFPNPNNLFHSVNEEVFVPVTSAEVDLSDSLHRSRASAARAPDERSDRDSALANRADADGVTEVPAMPIALARRAASHALESIATERERWTASSFGRAVAVDGEIAELDAVLVAQGGPGPEYHGAFHYRFDAETNQWRLTGMSFEADGVEPLTRTFDPALPVE